ncbi:hypothetical protein L2725_19255 [Shewanella corallii]|uniref:Lipoprotein n=1 Tax=Shewanella corallii TaxID=560080 RepID=A0ABT0NBP0_9GAMM|nr:hypothetical protein [Shewanella corallii]MCL2915883.1 hypothetical protein [Shewanella corallii]
MTKSFTALLMMTALAGCQSTTETTQHWQLTQGELAYAGQTIDWSSDSLHSCNDCSIETDKGYHPSGPTVSHKLLQGNEWRAVKVEQFKNWVTVPHQQAPVKLPLSHNKDGSLMLRKPNGEMQHLNLHQSNTLQLDGQEFALWLDGYNPASRNWRYDNEHDAPAIKYTLLAL